MSDSPSADVRIATRLSRPPSGLVKVRRWIQPPLPRRVATPLLVVAASVLTALAGLLIEALFPVAKGGWALGWTSNRWQPIGFIVAGLVTVWSWWSLRVHSRGRGTLYYLRLISDTAPDLQQQAASQARKDYLGYRSITAWIDPGGGTADARAEVRAMSEELQRALNDDEDDSGFDFVPNLLFPAALAVGFDCALPANSQLREMNGRTGEPEFTWPLGCASASGQGCAADRTHEPAHYLSNSDADGPHIDAWPEATQQNPVVRSVWLELRMTGSAQPVDSIWKDGADVCRTVGVVSRPGDASPARLTYQPVAAEHGGLYVGEVAEGCAYWIGQTLRDYPDATVFVAVFAPKTVSLAIGHLLTRPPLDGAAAHPWRRIIPMGYFAGDTPPLRPMWVRHDQADPDELIRMLPAGDRAR